MQYLVFLDAVIDRGLAAAREDYAKRPEKLEGAVAGFEACRDKQPAELQTLLAEAREKTRDLHWDNVLTQHERANDRTYAYWIQVCYENEVEWVCNCVSALLANEGRPTIVPPTARAVIAAARIVGVALLD